MPSATNGETLLDRSQRILGVSLDQAEVEKNRTRKSNVSPGRRREQVAQAQRTHRHRTQRYIHELENEVLRLRNRDQATRQKNRILQEHIELLTHTLITSNVPVPDAPVAFMQAEMDEMTSDGSTLGDNDASSPMINVDLTKLASVEPGLPCSDVAAERIPTEVDTSSLSPNVSFNGANAGNSQQNSAATSPTLVQSPVACLDAQSGIDFILELEHPCLPHVKHAMMNDIDIIRPDFWQHNHHGPAHVFTATASLLQASRGPDATSHSFPMPQGEIDRLLNASRRLKLDNEMTPVQVWQKIKDVSVVQHVTPQLLSALTKDCSQYTFCNSFGTVIDKNVVKAIFDYHFSAVPL